MRNLLYTLLIGLVVISCQKEEYGADYSSISPLTDVEVTIDEKGILEALNRLSSVKFEKLNNITGRGTIGDYIILSSAVFEGNWYEFAFSANNANDDNEVCNLPSGFNPLYLTLASDNTLNIATSHNGEVALNLDIDVSSLFAADIVHGVQLTPSGVVTTGTATDLSISFN